MDRGSGRRPNCFLKICADIRSQPLFSTFQFTPTLPENSWRDILESNLSHQKEALREVIKVAKKTKSGKIISTMSGQGLLAKEEIANKIWIVVSKFLSGFVGKLK
jgi:hypothetical protein